LKTTKAILFLVFVLLCFNASAQEKNLYVVLAMPDDTVKLNELKKISNQFSSGEKYDSAIFISQLALQLSNKIKSNEGTIQCYSDEYRIYHLQGKDSLALMILSDAIKKCQELKYNHGFVSINQLFSSYYAERGEWQPAIKYSNYVLLSCDSVKEASLYAATLSKIGMFNNFLGNSNEGISAFLRGLKIAELAKDSFRISVIYNNMAMLYNNIGDAEKSKEYCYRSIAIKKKHDRPGLYFPYQNLGYVYNTLSINYDSSLYYYRLAEPLANEAGNKSQLGNIYQNLSAIFDRKGMQDSSMLYAQKSLDMFLAVGNKSGAAGALNALGVRWRQKGERTHNKNLFIKSLNYYKLALKYAEESGGLWKQNTFINMSQLYQSMGDYKNAYKYELLYREIRDTLLNEEIVNNTAKLEAKFETEKKDNEINILTTENKLKSAVAEKQSQQKKFAYVAIAFVLVFSGYAFYRYRLHKKTELERSRLKDRLHISQGLHDDIGSTLSSISIYSQVAQKLSDKNEKENLGEMLEKISATSHEMVSEMNDIVWAINPKNDSMERIIQRMESFARPMLATRNISFRMNYDPAILTANLDMEKRKDFYLIFKEAVNNAFKYSGCSEISADITNSNRHLKLIVKDNGVGFDVQHEMTGNKLTLSGNGLRNMKARAEEMKGDLKFYSKPGEGAELRLSFPIP
jgi:signal transduction histidine kinase